MFNKKSINDFKNDLKLNTRNIERNSEELREINLKLDSLFDYLNLELKKESYIHRDMINYGFGLELEGPEVIKHKFVIKSKDTKKK